MSRFLDALGERVVLGDGAMGTELLRRGAARGRNLSRLNLENPELVLQVHREYVSAGAELLRTNTFTANRLRMESSLIDAANREGVRIAREAAGSERYVAGSVGPLSDLPGPIPEREACYREQMAALAQGGCDALVLETYTDANDLAIAVRAARSVVGLPLIAEMVILKGTPASSFRTALGASGAEVMGVNCTSPFRAAVASLELKRETGAPLAVFPSAGREEGGPPGRAGWGAVRSALFLAGRGIRLVGGCCGVGPEGIRALGEGLRRVQEGPEGGPEFPLSVLFENGEEVTLESSGDPETDLEDFDSKIEEAMVLDSLGRRVEVRISECSWRECRLASPEPGRPGGER